MKPDNYEFLATAVLRHSGLIIGEHKLQLLQARLAPLLLARGCSSVDSLVEQIRSSDGHDLLNDVVDAITWNETSFFADRSSYDVLFDTVIPALMKVRMQEQALRIWSAGCSTGQEPCSILMGLDQRVPVLQKWRIEIVATDINRKLLEHAKQGLYNHFEVQRGLPASFLIRFFTKAGNNYRLKPELGSRIRFHLKNLKQDQSELGVFDVIFCRDVLSGFDADTAKEVLHRVLPRLAPDGYLFLGASESRIAIGNSLKRMQVAGCVIWSGAGVQPVAAVRNRT